MRARFNYERRRYATMVEMRHGLATLNTNNSFSVLQQNCIVYSYSIQGALLSILSNGLGNKTVISCLMQ